MRDIDQARVDDYVSFCRTQKIKAWRGGPHRDPDAPKYDRFWVTTEKTRAIATCELYLGTLKQIIARAAAHSNPETGRPSRDNLPKVPQLRRPKRKARPMPDDVATTVMAIMPAHIIDAMMLTAFFGFRRAEVFTLHRHNIDWQAQGIRLFAEDVKDREDVFLPASQFAMGWLWCLDLEAERRGTRRLITWQRRYKDPEAYRDAPAFEMKAPRSTWRRAQALMRSKYGRSWRWHDLRAAFITHVAINSGGVMAQTLARHSDPTTTQGYIEVADELRRLAAERLSARVEGLVRQKSPQQQSPTNPTRLRGIAPKPLKCWSEREDSNLRPPRPERGALPG